MGTSRFNSEKIKSEKFNLKNLVFSRADVFTNINSINFDYVNL